MSRGAIKTTSKSTCLITFIKIMLLKTINSCPGVAWRCLRLWLGNLSNFGMVWTLHLGLFERHVRTLYVTWRIPYETTVDHICRHIHCCQNTHIIITDSKEGILVLLDLGSSYTRRVVKTTNEKTALELIAHSWNPTRALHLVFDVKSFPCASNFTKTKWLASRKSVIIILEKGFKR